MEPFDVADMFGRRRAPVLHVGNDRVERIWRCEGLRVPQRQKPRGRLWLNDTDYNSCMNARDVLISRVHDRLGSPMSASPNSARDRVEELWAVTAEGKRSLTLHSFTEALDVALTWVGELGGEIYRRDRPGAAAELYKAAW